MRSSKFPLFQKGVALVLALLILLVLTVLGVASMGNITMQERMSGNSNLQALAFQAAASGIPGAVEFADGKECDHSDEDWTDVATTAGVVSQFKRTVLCREDQALKALGVTNIREQIYVRSEGRVVRNGGSSARALSIRQIEVQIAGGGQSDCAIHAQCIADFTDVDTPNSNNFLVDGGGKDGSGDGCSISVATETNRSIIEDSIHKNRVNSYRPNPPGILKRDDVEGPWGNLETMSSLINELRENLVRCGLGDDPADERSKFTRDDQCFLPSDPNDPNYDYDDCVANEDDCTKVNLGLCNYYAGPESRSGSGEGLIGRDNEEDFELHFVDGNLRLGGGTDSYGLVIATGDYSMSGNANVTGKILALGGGFEFAGGGGEETKGSIYMASLGEDGSEGDACNLDLSGGGDHQVYFDCEKANDAIALFRACGVEGFEPRNCGFDGDGGPGRSLKASWRENLGWGEF